MTALRKQTDLRTPIISVALSLSDSRESLAMANRHHNAGFRFRKLWGVTRAIRSELFAHRSTWASKYILRAKSIFGVDLALTAMRHGSLSASTMI